MKNLLLGIIIGVILSLSSGCENDIKKINALTSDLTLPAQSGKNVEVIYTDSGILKLKFKTPVLERYIQEEQSYYEFPKGIRVYSYDDSMRLESIIKARYAKYTEDEMLWEARNNVVAQNVQTDEKLETEQLFWDQDKEIIYSKVFTKITNEDGVFYGENGFEATQDLSNYKLKGSKGTVNVEDEED